MTDGQIRVAAYSLTDKGRVREGNEDNFYAGKTVFAVADGMGGHVAGEVASNLALKPIEELDGTTYPDPADATDALRAAIEAANANVIKEARANPDRAGMGTTLTAVIVRDDRIHLGHVGDSRAYLLRSGEAIDQLTTDHTLVEELVREGRLARDEIATHPQRSVITRAIGVDDRVEVDTLPPLVLQPGDQILLCSDGLTGPVDNDEITDILTSFTDGEEAVHQLIELANEHGGPDNITVVLLRVEGSEGDGRTARATAAGSPDAETSGGDSTSKIAVATAPSIPIRTRPESAGHDFASDFRRYADGRSGLFGSSDDEPGRWRRVVAGVLGALVLLAILGAGGWILLSRAWFVGVADGQVAIFNGLNETVIGINLYRLHSTSDVPTDALQPRIVQRLEDGITEGSLDEAEATVEAYREQAQVTPTEQVTPGPSPSPRARPRPTATPQS